MNENVLTDEELMLLEQLCYVDVGLCNAAEVRHHAGLQDDRHLRVGVRELYSLFLLYL